MSKNRFGVKFKSKHYKTNKNYIKIKSDMSIFKKIALVALVAVVLVPSVQAQTTSDLQAQITALLAQIQALQAQLGQGSQTSATFTKDLTLGSRGDEVSSLQGILISKGFLKISAPTGYFGAMTKAALASWQASVGISPASGYFGPITRAFLASSLPTPTPTPTTTTSPSPTTTLTPGVEAIVSAEYAPSPANNMEIKEGETDMAILGIRVKSKQGDANIERVKVDLGASTTIYTRVLSNLSLWNGSTKLATLDSNSTNVIKDGSRYVVTFTGFSQLVKAGESVDLTVKVSVQGQIDSTYRTTYTVYVPANAIRTVDGAGVTNQFPGTLLGNRTFRVANSQAEQATLAISKNASSPKASVLVGDTNGDVKEASLLIFDLKAEKGRAKVTDITATFTGNATTSAAYLYSGSNLIASASISGGLTTFADLSDIYVEKDQTRTFTIKADYTGASTNLATSTVAVDETLSGVLAENDLGDTIDPTGGSISADVQNVTSISPVFALVSASATYTGPAYSGASGTLKGTFVFDATAKGAATWFNSTGTFDFLAVRATGATQAATSTTYLQPTNATVDGVTYKLAQDGTARFTVDMTVLSSGVAASDYYSFKLSNIDWGTSATIDQTITYLDTTVWTTPSVYVQK